MDWLFRWKCYWPSLLWIQRLRNYVQQLASLGLKFTLVSGTWNRNGNKQDTNCNQTNKDIKKVWAIETCNNHIVKLCSNINKWYSHTYKYTQRTHSFSYTHTHTHTHKHTHRMRKWNREIERERYSVCVCVYVCVCVFVCVFWSHCQMHLQVAPLQITWLPGKSSSCTIKFIRSKCNEGCDWCIYVTVVVTCVDTMTYTLCNQ